VGFWDFLLDESHRPDFAPTPVDFGGGKVGGAWSAERLEDDPQGIPRYRFEGGAGDSHAPAGADEAWIFSAPFNFMSGMRYEIVLKCRSPIAPVAVPAKLTLRVGYAPEPTGQTHQLLEFLAGEREANIIRTSFEVPYDGTYCFSLEGMPGGPPVLIEEGRVGIEGTLEEGAARAATADA
jgi:hypothetical protein